MPINNTSYGGDYFQNYIPYLTQAPYPTNFTEASNIQTMYEISSNIPGEATETVNGISYHINEYIVGENENEDIIFSIRNKTYAGQEDNTFLKSKRGGTDLTVTIEFDNFIKLKSSNVNLNTNESKKIEYILEKQQNSEIVLQYNIPRLNKEVQTKYVDVTVTISFENLNNYLILTES